MFKPVSAHATGNKLYRCFGLLVAVVAWSAALPAAAQTTYKCGSTYSQNPCEGGVAVAADDKRTAEQKTQALNATQKEKQAADNLEQARLDKEKRERADLKKAHLVQNKATAKAGKTTVRPIKNKKMKVEPDLDSEKPAKKSASKKRKPASSEK